jgi:hypothetical protein
LSLVLFLGGLSGECLRVSRILCLELVGEGCLVSLDFCFGLTGDFSLYFAALECFSLILEPSLSSISSSIKGSTACFYFFSLVAD